MNESFIADRRSTSVEAIRARVGTAIDFTGVTTTNGLLGWSPPETGALWHAGGGQDGSLPLDRLSLVDRVPRGTIISAGTVVRPNTFQLFTSLSPLDLFGRKLREDTHHVMVA